jgi:hypothetical protein
MAWENQHIAPANKQYLMIFMTVIFKYRSKITVNRRRKGFSFKSRTGGSGMTFKSILVELVWIFIPCR